MTDIRVDTSFRDHRKRMRLESKLGPAGVVAVIDLWLWAGIHQPDGSLAEMEPDEIEAAARWRGEPGLFFATMTAVGFITEDRSLHNWPRRNGYAAASEARSRHMRKVNHDRAVERRDGVCGVPSCEFCPVPVIQCVNQCDSVCDSDCHSDCGSGSGSGNVVDSNDGKVAGATSEPIIPLALSEAAEVYNAAAARMVVPKVTDRKLRGLVKKFDRLCKEIDTPEFSLSECVARLIEQRTDGSEFFRSWAGLDFEWLMQRERSGSRFNAWKVWNGHYASRRKGVSALQPVSSVPRIRFDEVAR